VAAPLLGEHTLDILQNTLGYDQHQIAEFSQKGVFGLGKGSV